MNNLQRQLLVVFLASMGVGLLGGLAYNVTSRLIRPNTIDLDEASPDQNSRPCVQGLCLARAKQRHSGSRLSGASGRRSARHQGFPTLLIPF